MDDSDHHIVVEMYVAPGIWESLLMMMNLLEKVPNEIHPEKDDAWNHAEMSLSLSLSL